MKPIKERKFIDKESGITSEMIDQCTDMNELLNWKMVIESNIVSSQMQIDTMRGEQAKTGIYADIKKWVGTNGYRRACGFLSQKIQHKLRELNYSFKQSEQSIYELFYVRAKIMLPEEQFLEIKETTYQLREERKVKNNALP